MGGKTNKRAGEKRASNGGSFVNRTRELEKGIELFGEGKWERTHKGRHVRKVGNLRTPQVSKEANIKGKSKTPTGGRLITPLERIGREGGRVEEVISPPGGKVVGKENEKKKTIRSKCKPTQKKGDFLKKKVWGEEGKPRE